MVSICLKINKTKKSKTGWEWPQFCVLCLAPLSFPSYPSKKVDPGRGLDSWHHLEGESIPYCSHCLRKLKRSQILAPFLLLSVLFLAMPFLSNIIEDESLFYLFTRNFILSMLLWMMIFAFFIVGPIFFGLFYLIRKVLPFFFSEVGVTEKDSTENASRLCFRNPKYANLFVVSNKKLIIEYLGEEVIEQFDSNNNPSTKYEIKCPECGYILSKPDWRCPECYCEFENYNFDTGILEGLPIAKKQDVKKSTPNIKNNIKAKNSSIKFILKDAVQKDDSKAIKEICEYYKSCYKKEYDAARDRVLKSVRVYPGQDPYMAGHTALLQQEDAIVRSAQSTAERETIAKYKITTKQLRSMIT